MTEDDLTDPGELSPLEAHGKAKGKLLYADEPLSPSDVAAKLAWEVEATEAILKELSMDVSIEKTSDGFVYLAPEYPA